MGKRSTTTSDVELLAAIYRDQLRRVRWVLRARGISGDELDDVVHDVFLSIHRRLPVRDDALDLSAWVCGVARSVAFAHRRGAARRRDVIAAVPEPDARPLPDEELARREAWHRLAAALEGLHDDQREVFVLVDVMGMRAAEVAQLVDAPVNTVYSRLRLARRHCEVALALPASVDRAAWLRAAAQGEGPAEQDRRRAWTRILAVLPAAASPAAASPIATSSLTPWVFMGTLVAAALTGAAALVPTPSPASSRDATIAAPAPPGAGKATAVVPPPSATPTLVVGPSATPKRPTSRPRAVPVPVTTPAPVASPADDPLADAVELLREGKAELAAGHPAAALAIVDRHRSRFGDGPLQRDVLRLERSAACSEPDARRATTAHAALVELGLARPDDPACP